MVQMGEISPRGEEGGTGQWRKQVIEEKDEVKIWKVEGGQLQEDEGVQGSGEMDIERKGEREKKGE